MTDSSPARSTAVDGPSAGAVDRPGNAMPHLPGLDGLRGLAVIGVLLFHGGFTWAQGGYLGVSTFFTLSGFLITNLLVREWDRTSSISLGRFWTRRFRRLMPAAVVAIGLVGLVWWFVGTPEQLQNLRADMLTSLGYVANWRFLFAGRSYAELFSAPSPLQHFWSLAIEEQFYVFFPLVTIVLMRLGGRRVYTGVLAAATAGSIFLTLVFSDDFDRVYYGTDTRAAELLMGALLAVWWSGRTTRGRFAADDPARPSPVIDALGIVALAGMFWAWWAVPEASAGLSKGGLPLYAVGTTVIVLAATRRGLVTALLSIPFLRWAGLVSYGLYLYHWPIFLVLSPDRTGLSTGPLFVVRMAATIAVAVLSYFLLEQPIRRGTMIRTGRAALSAAVAGAAIVAVVAVSVTLDPPRSTGRDLFNPQWLQDRLGGPWDRLAPADIQATLTRLTAEVCARELLKHLPKGIKQILLREFIKHFEYLIALLHGGIEARCVCVCIFTYVHHVYTHMHIILCLLYAYLNVPCPARASTQGERCVYACTHAYMYV